MKIVVFMLTYVGTVCEALNPHKLIEAAQIVTSKNVISSECADSLNMYISRLNSNVDEDIWALKMLDATSTLPVGLLSHNVGEMGNFEQCIKIDSKVDSIKGKYCLGKIRINTIVNHHIISHNENQDYIEKLEHVISNAGYESEYPSWAMCLPSNCTDADAKEIISVSQKLGTSVVTLSCQTISDVYPPIYTDAVIGITILTAIITIVIVSTAYDYHCQTNEKESRSAGYVAFSLYTNVKNLCRMPKRSSSLDCLDGIKVISMLWLMAGHTTFFYTRSQLMNYDGVIEHMDSIISTVFFNGHFACDTFFLIGGTLVTYGYFKKDKQQKITYVNIIKHYFHRYIRLTPALAAIVLISGTLLRYMGSGPRWPAATVGVQDTCLRTWWSPLLYVQNQVNDISFCTAHTWYLDIDMQLFILSPFIFWILQKHTKIGMLLLSGCATMSIICTFLIAWSHELTDIWSSNFAMMDFGNYLLNYYTKTETRCAPWFLGIILGYMLTQKQFNRKSISKKVMIFLWILSIAVMFLSLTWGHLFLRGRIYNRLHNALYIALVTPCFSFAVIWVIWACANDFGGIINQFLSLQVFKFLNKLNYSAYLLHHNIILFFIAAQKAPLYFSLPNVIYWYFGLLFCVFCSSIIWVLVFESPMVNLEKVIIKNIECCGSNKPNKNSDNC